MPPKKTTEFGPLFDLPPARYELAAAFTVRGEPGRKSNSRQIVRSRATGKPLVIKGPKAAQYGQDFLRQVPAAARLGLGSPSEPLALWAHIHYASNRPDLSAELLQDLLEAAGVVSNDRWIKQVFLFAAVDPFDPRSDLRIYRIHPPAKETQ